MDPAHGLRHEEGVLVQESKVREYSPIEEYSRPVAVIAVGYLLWRNRDFFLEKYPDIQEALDLNQGLVLKAAKYVAAFGAAVAVARTVIAGTPLMPDKQLPAEERLLRHKTLRSKPEYDRIMAKKNEMAQRLSQAIKCRTVLYDLDLEGHQQNTKIDFTQFEKLQKLLEDGYPNAMKVLKKTVINKYSAIFHWEGSDKTQQPYCMLAHCDVVPVDDQIDLPPGERQWSVDPFAGVIKDGYVWGRGAIDLKNMVFGYMEALDDLAESGFKPKRDIYLCINHDEETGGEGGANFVSEWFLQNLGPNCFEFVWDEGLFVIHELLPMMDAPCALVGIAEKGIMDLRLSVSLNEGGHSSSPLPVQDDRMPFLGWLLAPYDPHSQTAIGILARAVQRLERNPLPSTFWGNATSFFEAIRSEFAWPMRLLVANLWLFRPLLLYFLKSDPRGKTSTMVRTTTAITVFKGGEKSNVMPKSAWVNVNHRIHPNDTIESVIAHDKAVVGDERIEFEEACPPVAPSPISDHHHPAFDTFRDVCASVYPDAAVAPSLFVAASDSKWFWDLSPQIFRFNPIRLHMSEVGMFHGIDEKIGVHNYAEMVLFMREIILETDKRNAPKQK
eukprot:m.52895 g.52895  ORF g.52895 m.52895 type:complete len:612 (-) comp10827_c0_seq1:96-1931(-)